MYFRNTIVAKFYYIEYNYSLNTMYNAICERHFIVDTLILIFADGLGFQSVAGDIFFDRTKRENTTQSIENIIYLLLLIIVCGGHGGRHPRRRNWYRFSSSSTCLMYGRSNASGRCYPASRSRSLCPYFHIVSGNNTKCRVVKPAEIKLQGFFFLFFLFFFSSFFRRLISTCVPLVLYTVCTVHVEKKKGTIQKLRRGNESRKRQSTKKTKLLRDALVTGTQKCHFLLCSQGQADITEIAGEVRKSDSESRVHSVRSTQKRGP